MLVKRRFFNLIRLYNGKAVDWELNSKNSACSHIECWVWVWRSFNVHGIFGKFGLSRFWCKVQSRTFFSWSSTTSKSFDWDLRWQNQTSSYREISIRMSTWIKRFSDYQDFDARTKCDNFSWEWFTASSKLPIGNLIQEIKQVVMEKWSNWKSSSSKINSIFCICGVSASWHTKENQIFFQRIPYTSRGISTKMKELSLVFLKSELQLPGISILMAPLQCEFFETIFYSRCFRKKNYHFLNPEWQG